MKKFLVIPLFILALFSCQNEETINSNTESQTLKRRICASQEVLQAQLAADPTLAMRMNQIEEFTQKVKLTQKLVNGKVVIPVVVNVLYRTATENISDTQIQSQIDVLNQDFTATNSDFSSTPSLFTDVAATIGITFELVKINRKATTKSSWGTKDAMKKNNQGGIAPTSPSTTLNIWACTIGGGILGYAQFPGGAAATDGVVIDSKYFGVSSNSGISYPYNLGRTATHEVGHWMNLRHIWGDTNCGSDLVTDTPTHNEANFGVPIYPHLSTCAGTPVEMTMNYMDYTDDRGMYMFTNGQKARINAIFVSGGARSSFGI
ncbi:zinc metalloprotease [Flavobacterium sp. TSSA_36]|uniref:zinc metalloprotease n=1 Tax=Flavobacterium sp. TSSA_36 TaxID=3447669 RepID=UPI003F2A76C7